MKRRQSKFPRCLPDTRLGVKHKNLDSFRDATQQHGQCDRKSNEYSLVVVTEEQTPKTTRLLLGMRKRSNGESGFYNPFGGSLLVDQNNSAEALACRELAKATNLKVPLEEMARSKVGVQRYTFENNPVQKIVNVYRIKLDTISSNKNSSHTVKGSDEINPKWFDDMATIPFDEMFADMSLWLTALLSSSDPLRINGSYHFEENTNTILHYYLDIRPKKSDFSMEQRLFHTLHESQSNLVSIKEFKESFAFCNAVRQAFTKGKHKNDKFDVVIDVAGGHGALAALFLICTTASHAVVVDPANVGGGRIQEAWGRDFIGNHKKLQYRRECLRTGLPDELEKALKMTTRSRILVVACHACSHLSEEILEIACNYRVHVAVMPCCQKDRTPGSPWKAVSKNLSVPIAKLIDVLQCGKIMALGSHDVRLKCIDAKITPQNRIIVCRALSDSEILEFHHQRQDKVNEAHSKLELVYQKAHQVQDPKKKTANIMNSQQNIVPPFVWYVAAGFVAGLLSAGSFRKK